MTGSCNNGVWKFYSLHRDYLVSTPCLVTSQSPPSCSLRWVINSSAYGGRDISQPSADRVGLLDQVFKLNHFKSFFSLFSVFSPFSWYCRLFSFYELLRLWDFSPSFYRALSLKTVSGFRITVIFLLKFWDFYFVFFFPVQV